jgi:quinol monooxygenase YgiN
MLTGTFDARPGSEETLLAALARYVVLTRHEPACRNVDLVASVTHGGRFVVIEKWDSADAVQRHLDSQLMTQMANEVLPTLAAKPAIDLYDTISAHDLM